MIEIELLEKISFQLWCIYGLLGCFLILYLSRGKP